MEAQIQPSSFARWGICLRGALGALAAMATAALFNFKIPIANLADKTHFENPQLGQ